MAILGLDLHRYKIETALLRLLVAGIFASCGRMFHQRAVVIAAKEEPDPYIDLLVSHICRDSRTEKWWMRNKKLIRGQKSSRYGELCSDVWS